MPERFDKALYGVGDNLKQVLEKIPASVKQDIQEIRLRKGLPLAVTVAGETVFVCQGGQTCFYPQSNGVRVEERDVEQSFRLLCNNSVYAHEGELKNGYIRLKNGCRAGVFGTVGEDGNMQDITGINIRIAREFKGVSKNLAMSFRGEGWLILGPPCSGKTTVLRDFIRLISSGATGKTYRVCVIDSRGELFGSGENDLGAATDVLNIQNKAKGIEMALRTMFPEVIAFDEIGTTEELSGVMEGFNAGVSVITTAHIGSKEEIFTRRVTAELLQSGAISRVAVLPKICGGKIAVYTLGELINADF